MTIGPKKKISIYKKHRRHSTWEKLNLKRLTNKYAFAKCTHCSKFKLTHRVCPHCGFYAGKQIITIKTNSKKKIMEA